MHSLLYTYVVSFSLNPSLQSNVPAILVADNWREKDSDAAKLRGSHVVAQLSGPDIHISSDQVETASQLTW